MRPHLGKKSRSEKLPRQSDKLMANSKTLVGTAGVSRKKEAFYDVWKGCFLYIRCDEDPQDLPALQLEIITGPRQPYIPQFRALSDLEPL